MSPNPAVSRRRFALGASVALIALALLPAACGRRAAGPTRPTAVPLPPEIVTVSPAPRSVGVPYDSLHIWAEFAAPLDPSSVTTTNVFLKIDTQRLPIQVRWDPDRRRVVIGMTTTVLLQQTYTIVLSPNLRSADGVPFGKSWSWQFTVNSVRRPRLGYPNGQMESPFTPLSWVGNAAADGAAVYTVTAGTDSAAVAARTARSIYSGPLTRILPPARWPQDQPVYWAVNTVSPVTGESLPGPVWRFTTDPSSAPVDSIAVPLDFSAYAFYNESGWWTAVCRGLSIIVGPGYNTGLSWDMSGIPGASHFAGARMTLSALSGYEDWLTAPNTSLSLWYATASWTCTRTQPNGPPNTDEMNGQIARARIDASAVATFESDTLTAYLESTFRNGGPRGFLPRCNRLLYLASQTDAARRPKLTVWVYKRTTADPASAARH